MLCEKRLLRDHVHGAQGFFQRRDWLQIANHPHFLAIGDSAFNASCPIRQVVKPALLIVVSDFVMSLRSAFECNPNALPDFNGFHGINAHDRLRQAAVEARIPARMGTQPYGDAAPNNLEGSTDGVAILLGPLNLFNHLLSDIRQDASHDFVIANGLQLRPGNDEVIRNARISDRGRVTEDFDTEVAKENLRNAAGRDSSGGFAGARALENVPGIRVVVFQRARKIGMTRTRACDAAFGCGVTQNLASRHDFFPIRPVPILDHHGDRTSNGLPVPHSGEKTYLILLDFHAAASAIAALTPFQLIIDEFEIDGEVCRNAFHERDQGLAM